jgi:hypothetical protein
MTRQEALEDARARVLESGLEKYRAVTAALAFRRDDYGPEWTRASQRAQIAQHEHWTALKQYARLIDGDPLPECGNSEGDNPSHQPCLP